MSGWTSWSRHLYPVVAASIVLVTASGITASASTLGGVSSKSLFARNVVAPAVVPRMRVADSFTSGTFVSGRVPQSVRYSSSTWTVVAGNWSIAAGVAVPQANGTRIAIYGVDTANVLAAVTLNRQTGFDAGLIVRSNPAGTTYLLAEFKNGAGGSVNLRKIVTGTATTIASATNLGNLNVIPLRVETSGAQVTVRYNSASVISYTLTAAEQTIFGGLTSVGIWVNNATSETFDDFYVASWPAT